MFLGEDWLYISLSLFTVSKEGQCERCLDSVLRSRRSGFSFLFVIAHFMTFLLSTNSRRPTKNSSSLKFRDSLKYINMFASWINHLGWGKCCMSVQWRMGSYWAKEFGVKLPQFESLFSFFYIWTTGYSSFFYLIVFNQGKGWE